MLFGRVFLNRRSGVPAKHVVDRRNYLQHLGFGDEAVAVLVVQPEYPLQLLLNTPSRYL